MKLSPELNIAVTVAINEAASRGHEYAGLEHLLYALLHHDTETTEVIRHCGGDVVKLKEKLARFLDQSIEKVPNGLHVQPDLTAGFKRVLTRAAAHVDSSGKDLVGGKNVLVALFAERDSFALHFLQEQGIERLDVVSYISHGISKIEPEEGGLPAPTGEPGDEDGEPGGATRRDPLEAFCVNLNQMAADGKIDPLIGREKEIERTVHVLCRRRKNNPLFVGDAGVGKTALAEGLALKIVNKEVPDALHDAVVYGLDMGAVLAGTRYRGDFEQRIKAVLKALEKLPKAILAIDEIHTLIGAGSASGGAMDASNLLKPALA